MNDLPDFFTMDAEQIIIWADENKIKIDKRMGKDKLIDAILTELDGAETQETPAAPVEPEMTAKAPDVALKPAKPAKAAKSKLSDLEINDNVPEYTVLESNTALCNTPPTGMICTPNINAETLNWQFTGDPLVGGAGGYVSYEVRVNY